MIRTPLTVISGYLGAGKTTLINRLLAEPHGKNLLVMVNDFGAINIDADLLRGGEDGTIALTNGCVCCTMGADLHLALSAALTRTPPPDHIIVEASGIADPAAIAATAIENPDLSYAGIVTLVDADNAPDLLADNQTAALVSQQIAAADLVLVTKTDVIGPDLHEQLARLHARNAAPLGDDTAIADLLLDVVPLPRGRGTAPHPAFTTWHHRSDRVFGRAELGEKLNSRPQALYRLKGFVQTDDGPYEVHVVGRRTEARRCRDAEETVLVGLGLSGLLEPDAMDRWWNDAT